MNEKLLKILDVGNDDYFSLTDTEQDIFLLGSLINCVNDGKIADFYRNDCGAYHEQLLDLLNSLELDEAAFVIESVAAIFPDGYPPEDNDERNEMLSELEEDYPDLFEEWADQILQFISDLNSSLNKLLSELE